MRTFGTRREALRTLAPSWSASLAVSLLLAGCGSTTPTAGGTAGPNASGSAAALGWLHVVSPDTGTPYLADQHNRRVILRGAAASGFEDQAYTGSPGAIPNYPIATGAYNGHCPADNGRAPDPPLCEVEASKPGYAQSATPGSGDDLAQMRAFGFDMVRLTLSWSLLEPVPGRYSTAYLDRVSQVVNWAAQQGIYVILDMHQDGYSRFLSAATAATADRPGCTPSNGQDGAPQWAVVADGQPSCELAGQNELNPAMAAAFQNFWDNTSTYSDGQPIPKGDAPGPGLEDHYIGALAAIAARFETNPTVLGYEIMNEPLPGAAPGAVLPVSNLYAFSDTQLYPFYQRAIEALTGVRDGKPKCEAEDPSATQLFHKRDQNEGSPEGYAPCAYPGLTHVSRQQIFVEPTGYTNLADIAPQVSLRFTGYPNLVFSPHVYTHVFTADTYPGSKGTYPAAYTFGYATAMAEAQSMHAALLVTEYGDSPSNDTTILNGMTAAQEQALSGSVFWTWKENCGSADKSNCANGWGVYMPPAENNGHPTGQNGKIYPSRRLYLQRGWPVDTAGTLLGETFDPATHSFVMSAASYRYVARGDRTADTVIYLPPTTKGPVTVTGAAMLDALTAAPGGSGRIAFVAPTGHGDYAVQALGFPDGRNRAEAKQWSVAMSQFEADLQHPLQPIGEVQARAIFDGWAACQTSPIISAISSVLLGPPGNDPNLDAGNGATAPSGG